MIIHFLYSILMFFWCSYCFGNSWAEKTLQHMTLRQKIGQLFIVVTSSLPSESYEFLSSMKVKDPYILDHEYIEKLIREYHAGGIIFNYKNRPQEQIKCINHFQEMSEIPLLIAQDCEWGLAMRHEGTIAFPRAMTLGAVENKQLLYELGKEIGRQCKLVGVHMNLAPVVDVNCNPKNPVILDRSFSDDPARVAECAITFMKGMHASGILVCAKHFPGHGDTNVDSHMDLPVIKHSRDRLDNIEFDPFKKMIKAGVDAIMTAHLCVPALDSSLMPATTSKIIVQQLLKEELEFQGLVITDGMGMRGILQKFEPGVAEYKAFLAGTDIILCPVDMPKAVNLIEQAVKENIVSEQELDKRILKILKVKEKLGLNGNRFVPTINDMQSLNTPAAYELQKRLYQEAATLIGKDIPQLDNACLILMNKQESPLKKLNLPVYTCNQITNVLEFNDMCNFVGPYKTVILAVFGTDRSIANRFGVTDLTLQFVDYLKSNNKKSVIMLCAIPYCLSFFKNADSVLLGYQNVEQAEYALLNVLNNKFQAIGKLPIKL